MQAVRRAGALGAHVVELDQFSSEPAGTVLSQDLAPGTRLAAGATIALTVSKGAAGNAMPGLAGATAAAAMAKLRALQLAPLRFTVVSDAPAGIVVSTYPARGVVLRYGDQARVNVSGGIPAALRGSLRAPARVPDVRGASVERAQDRLRALGLSPDLFYVRSARPPGLVVRQTVGAGARVHLGTLVGLAVSLGPEATASTPVPYVVGRPAAAAEQLLRTTGFQPRLVTQRAGAPGRAVRDEQPMGGTKAPPHAVVTIVIAA